MGKLAFRSLAFVFLVWFHPGLALAQTDIHITGPQSGFPIAVPQFCDQGQSEPYNIKIPEAISKNLQMFGLFRVLLPASYVETPGKCGGQNNIAFSDWSVIGTDLLVKGEISRTGRNELVAKIYLYDVVRQQAVIGKQYQASEDEYLVIANRFSNEVMRFVGSEEIFGTSLVFVSKVGRFKELFLMDATGSGIRQITKDIGLALSPAWSPEGDRIVYTSYRTKQPELHVISVKGGGASQLTKRSGLELGAEFTPDGQRILASASIAGDSNLIYFDLKGNIISHLTKGGSIDVSPSFSPDGSQVAFCSNRAGGPQIYIMSSNGPSSPKRISFTQSSYCTSPVWSPRGDRVAFVCLGDGGNQLFVTDPAGGNTVQLTFQGKNEDPSWSPKGQFLVFSSDMEKRGRRSIYVMHLDTAHVTRITSDGDDSQPVWGPVSSSS